VSRNRLAARKALSAQDEALAKSVEARAAKLND
jgi:hypothetical protein